MVNNLSDWGHPVLRKKYLKYILVLGCFMYITPPYLGLNALEKQKTQAFETEWPRQWLPLKNIVESRVHQSKAKMKLSESQMQSLESFLKQLSKASTPELLKLQKTMPKTTVELLRSVESRGVSLEQAEKMAAYLSVIHQKFDFQNPAPFDENTSHIMGRAWQEIDYSGENMTWEKQRQKYSVYGIQDFKSVEMLEKFFPVEATLPYFKKIYKPRGSL